MLHRPTPDALKDWHRLFWLFLCDTLTMNAKLNRRGGKGPIYIDINFPISAEEIRHELVEDWFIQTCLRCGMNPREVADFARRNKKSFYQSVRKVKCLIDE